MFEGMSKLFGAGVITAGVSAAMLAGAGVAIADTEPGAGGQTSTSDSSESGSGRTERDTTATDSETQDDNQGTGSGSETGVEDTDDTGDTADVEDVQDVETADVDEDVVAEDADDVTDVEGAEDGVADPSVVAPEDAPADLNTQSDPRDATDASTEAPHTAAEPAAAERAAEPEQPTATAAVADEIVPTAQMRVEPAAASRPQPAAVAEPAPVIERLSIVSAADASSAAAAAPRETLLSILGAVMFNLYSFAIRVVGGPPLLPWDSTVTVASSTLEIDCGDGYEVPADWYVPEGPTPTQLIYLQHGFLAAGPFYSYTAARLAEATGSIVVATSLTSNFLACDGCWVGGSPMHKSVAGLFVDGNTALAASAAAAGYGPSLLDGVTRVVLTGHSAGGGLAIGAAGYMADNGSIDRLAGVVMLDGVGFGSVTPDALAKLPGELPVYNLAGQAYFWNLNATTAAALEKERPGQFNGVRLIGGLHSDTMLGGNPLIQAGLNLVTGWSKIENVKAAELLSAAWINDMFAGSPTSPYYGAAGTMLEIETSRGTAEAYVMPGPPERLTPFDLVFQLVADMVFSLDFATCVAPSAGPAARQTAHDADNVIELPTPNTALSLDAGTKPVQAIGQHVCTG